MKEVVAGNVDIKVLIRDNRYPLYVTVTEVILILLVISCRWFSKYFYMELNLCQCLSVLDNCRCGQRSWCLLTCIICVSLQSTVLWKLTWKDTRDTNDSSLPALQSSDNDDFNCSEDYNSDLDQGMGTYSKKYQKAQQKPTRITNLKA